MWSVKIHPLVLKEDFKRIDASHRRLIFGAIRKKLTQSPNLFGEPLRGEFSEFRKLRVEDYRIVYRLREKMLEVLVVKVGIRRDFEVYRELSSRLKKLAR